MDARAEELLISAKNPERSSLSVEANEQRVIEPVIKSNYLTKLHRLLEDQQIRRNNHPSLDELELLYSGMMIKKK